MLDECGRVYENLQGKMCTTNNTDMQQEEEGR